ncbi:hAT transposon superfamily protein [Zea mays]|uniref:HAT transposon superfamily protein n=1 Tax=Zea mays TaxID=4577 RepID=A0A1D6GSR5_MAIZE|nr:hAT transposon superfamily protein [Zea mays]
MSNVSHTSEVIFELVDKAIQDLGPDSVVQVVTDNASNNMGAKALLHDKRPNIFWSSCATHIINLMLQGIGNLPRFKKRIDQANSFTIFVYGHHRTLACMKSFTLKRDIIRPGVTRFATTYLTLQSMMEKKDDLRKMVFEPLVKLLRLVDGDVKPSMGFLYGELINEKKAIEEAFGNVEIKYKEVMSIVEKKMKNRLDSPLHVAAYMLNPYYSYTNSSILCDSTIMEKFMLCVETFYHGEDEKSYRAVNDDLDRFQTKQGSFSKNMARSCQRIDFNPGNIVL